LAHLLPDNAATELTSFRSGLLKSDNFSVSGKCSSLSRFSSSYFRLESKALPFAERGCFDTTEV
jgi:hypothetical protein